MIKDLNAAKTTIDRAAWQLRKLQHENEQLKCIVWRLIKEHGDSIYTGEIEDTASLLKGTYIVNDANQVQFLNQFNDEYV